MESVVKTRHKIVNFYILVFFMKIRRKDWHTLRTTLLSVYDSNVLKYNRHIFSVLPNYIMWGIKKGKVEILHEKSEPTIVKQDEWCVIPPNFPKTHHFSDDAHIISCHFVAEWQNGICLFDLSSPVIIRESQMIKIRSLLSQMMLNDGRKPEVLSFGGFMEENVAFFTMLVELHKILAKHHIEINQKKPIDPRVETALLTLDKCSRNRVVPYADITQTTGLAKGQLDRLFLSEIGKTPSKYLENSSLQAAMMLLTQTKMSAKEVCFELGFSDMPQFSKWLKRLTGKTPKEFGKMVL